jgi:trk system potassium uptake protein TrkA
MATRRFAVIGLGRFGSTLAQGLAASGQEVIAIDSGQELIEGLQDVVDQAVRLDATDEKALRAQGVDKVDVAVVCIGENFEANLLATALLLDMGVPEVVARARSSNWSGPPKWCCLKTKVPPDWPNGWLPPTWWTFSTSPTASAWCN